MVVALEGFTEGAPICTNNFVGGTCIGNITYTSSTALSNNINASGSITINSGVTLTTAGFGIWIAGNLVNSGTIRINDGGNAGGTGTTSTCTAGTSAPNSLSGSGGGGGGASSTNAGCRGGNTLVLGGAGGAIGVAGSNGLANSVIIPTNANIISWFSTGFQRKLSGAGGGGGGGRGTAKGGNGGMGANGIYIQAANIIGGTMTDNGVAGQAGVTGGPNWSGGGGGGGGGVILLAYGLLTPSFTANVMGGPGGTTTSSSAGVGGRGGNGIVVLFNYAAQPLTTIKTPTANQLVPSNVVLDYGQYVTYNALITSSPGTGPYTANLVSSGIVLFDTKTGIPAGQSFVTFGSFQPPIGTDQYRVVATDTGSGFTFNSIYNAITVNTALVQPNAPSASRTKMNTAENETVSGYMPTTGTAPFAYTWLVSQDGGAYATATQCAVSSGTGMGYGNAVTCSIASNTLSAYSYYNFELRVTDGASAPVTATSAASANVIVHPALDPPTTPSVSAALLDRDQAETLASTLPYTGWTPYSYSWLVSENGNPYVPATQCAVNSGTDAAANAAIECGIGANTLTAGNAYAFKVQVTDNASTPDTETSAASATIQASSALSAPAAPTVELPKISVNDVESVTGHMPTTGTQPYSYSWLVSVNGGPFSAATQCTANSGSGRGAGNTVVCTIPANTLSTGSAYGFELAVTDGASTPESATSAASGNATVYSILQAPAAPLLSGSMVQVSQAVDVNGTLPTTGVPAYSYTWLLSANGSAYTTATQCAVYAGTGQAAGNSVVCHIPGNTLSAGNNYTFMLSVVDNATAPHTANSPQSATLLVYTTATPAKPDPSSTKLDVNQVEAVNGTIPTGGIGPYSYTWLISENGGNYTAATQCAKYQGTGENPGNAISCAIPAYGLSVGATYAFILQVTDNASATTNSVPSNTVAVASALTTASTPSVSAALLDTDQAETLSSTLPSTGTAPYYYEWQVSENGNPYIPATQCAVNAAFNAIGGSTATCAIAANALMDGFNYTFRLVVDDNASIAASTSSGASALIKVSQALAAPGAPTASTLDPDVNDTETVTGFMPTTGTQPYSYSWLVSVNNGVFSPSTMCTANGGTGRAPGNEVVCTVPPGTMTDAHTYAFKLQVTDNATIHEAATSDASDTVTAHSTLMTASKPSLTAAFIDMDQGATLTSTLPSTGTPPYTYNWQASIQGEPYITSTFCAVNSGYNALPSSVVECAIAANALTAGYAYNFRVQVIDNSSMHDTTSSSASDTLSVASRLLTPAAPTTIDATVFQGSDAEITGVMPTSGTLPYMYTWLVEAPGSGSFVNATSSECEVPNGSGASADSIVTCNFRTSASTATGDYLFKLHVADSATVAEQVTSGSIAVSVKPMPTISLSSSNYSISSGGTVTLTATIPSGEGVGPFTVDLISAGTALQTKTIPAGGGTVAFTVTLTDGGTAQFMVSASDLGITPTFVFNSTTVAIAVAAAGGGAGETGGSVSIAPAPQLLSGYTSNGFVAQLGGQTHTFNATLCGQGIEVKDTSISPDSAGVTINGAQYTLQLGIPVSIPGTACYLALTGTNYPKNPYVANFTLTDSSSNSVPVVLEGPNTTVNICLSNSSPVEVSMMQSGTHVHIAASGSETSCAEARFADLTPSAQPNVANMTKIVSVLTSVASTSALAINITFHYQCGSYEGLAPYKLVGDAWDPITQFSVNETACIVTFAVPPDPTTALFGVQIAPTTSSTTIPSTTRTTSSIPANGTTSVAPAPSEGSADGALAVLVVVAAAAAAAYFFLRLKKVKRKGAREAEQAGRRFRQQ